MNHIQWKKAVNMFQKIHIQLYKTSVGGGGPKAVYKLYKKSGNLVLDGFPIKVCLQKNMGLFENFTKILVILGDFKVI